MSRVQLALNVGDLDAAIGFYSRLFGTEPAKVRPGYANFAVADPPLKLVLIEDRSQVAGSLNHLGVEAGSSREVVDAQRRLSEAGLRTATEQYTACCYALQDKVWVDGPDGDAWEIYTVLSDAALPAGVVAVRDRVGGGVLRHPAGSGRRPAVVLLRDALNRRWGGA